MPLSPVASKTVVPIGAVDFVSLNTEVRSALAVRTIREFDPARSAR